MPVHPRDSHEMGIGPGGSQTVEVTIGGRSFTGPAFEPATRRPRAPVQVVDARPAEVEGTMSVEELYAWLLRCGPFARPVYLMHRTDNVAAEWVSMAGGRRCLFVDEGAWQDAMACYTSDCGKLATFSVPPGDSMRLLPNPNP